MKIIFSLLYIALLLTANNSYQTIKTDKYDITIKTTLDKGINQNLNVFINEKLIKTYNFEGSIPRVKLIVHNKKELYLALLIGWRTLHRGLNINGEYYNLDIFKIQNNNSIIQLNALTKNGFDGQSEEGNEIFKYKTKENILNYLSNILKEIEHSLKIKLSNQYDLRYLQNLIALVSINKMNLVKYNNIAYYLQKIGAYKEAVYLLERIIEKYPNRTVAYINLGDSYFKDNKKEKAIKNYIIYVKQMKENNKEKRIPKRVLDIIDNSNTSKIENLNNNLEKGNIPKIKQNTSKITPIKKEETFLTKLLELFGISNKNITIIQS